MILVTGGTGCIGSNLVRHLVAEGFHVRVLVHKNATTIENLDVERCHGDMLDLQSLVAAMKGCKWVFHIAGHFTFWSKERQKSRRVNCDGATNVCKAMHRTGVQRLVFNSTMGTIACSHDGSLVADETTPYNYARYRLVYNDVKWATERIFLEGIGSGLPIIILNPSLVIGEWDVNLSMSRVFLLLRNPLYRQFYVRGGTGVVDANDLAVAHLNAMRHGRLGERYIVNNHNVTGKELLGAISATLGTQPPRVPVPATLFRAMGHLVNPFTLLRSSEPFITRDAALSATLFHYVSGDKARNEFGYPCTSLRQSLDKAYTWLVEHHPAFGTVTPRRNGKGTAHEL